MGRNLGALAGLAALGAMAASRKKGSDTSDRDTDTGVDVQPSYAQQKPTTAAMDPLESANNSADAQAIANEDKGDTILKQMRDQAAMQKKRPKYNIPFDAGRGNSWDNSRTMRMNKGGKVVKMAKGGMTASARADGIAQKGKTRGKMC
jgi:hypothetical protein